ncbi:MAG: hypothetical protein ACRDKW_01010 [Actinomycetota bacterium]
MAQDRLQEFIDTCEEASERDVEAREIATPYALARIALALEKIGAILASRWGAVEEG